MFRGTSQTTMCNTPWRQHGQMRRAATYGQDGCGLPKRRDRGTEKGTRRDTGDIGCASHQGCTPRLRWLQGLGLGKRVKWRCVLWDEKYQKEPQDRRRGKKNSNNWQKKYKGFFCCELETSALHQFHRPLELLNGRPRGLEQYLSWGHQVTVLNEFYLSL